jgi:hypothetical protein
MVVVRLGRFVKHQQQVPLRMHRPLATGLLAQPIAYLAGHFPNGR